MIRLLEAPVGIRLAAAAMLTLFLAPLDASIHATVSLGIPYIFPALYLAPALNRP